MNHPRAFVLTLPRAAERFARCQDHYRSVGIEAEPFHGLDFQRTGLYTEHKYEVDHPGSGYIMGPKQVSMHLSHYMLWKVMAYLPEDEFWVLEDDCQWDQGWQKQYETAKAALPADWDFVHLGSCCTSDKPSYTVADNLCVVQFPMCTHAYQVRKKALPVLLEACQKVWAPVDIALCADALPKLKHFCIIPRLCAQWNTFLPP